MYVVFLLRIMLIGDCKSAEIALNNDKISNKKVLRSIFDEFENANLNFDDILSSLPTSEPPDFIGDFQIPTINDMKPVPLPIATIPWDETIITTEEYGTEIHHITLPTITEYTEETSLTRTAYPVPLIEESRIWSKYYSAVDDLVSKGAFIEHSRWLDDPRPQTTRSIKYTTTTHTRVTSRTRGEWGHHSHRLDLVKEPKTHSYNEFDDRRRHESTSQMKNTILHSNMDTKVNTPRKPTETVHNSLKHDTLQEPKTLIYHNYDNRQRYKTTTQLYHSSSTMDAKVITIENPTEFVHNSLKHDTLQEPKTLIYHNNDNSQLYKTTTWLNHLNLSSKMDTKIITLEKPTKLVHNSPKQDTLQEPNTRTHSDYDNRQRNDTTAQLNLLTLTLDKPTKWAHNSLKHYNSQSNYDNRQRYENTAQLSQSTLSLMMNTKVIMRQKPTKLVHNSQK